jgi:hypothetical protein
MIGRGRPRDGLRRTRTSGARPLVVEIMGPAAAGKTTLIRTLCTDGDEIRSGIDVASIRSAGVFTAKAASFLPVWLLRRPRGRWFTWREVKSLAFLDLWYREVERGRPSGVVATLLDHGPLYRLTALREFGPEMARSERFERWWVAAFDRWKSTVDIVVWLDAPDELLLERVERRGHWYLSADRSIEEKHEFLGRYRSALKGMLEGFAEDGPTILRFETGRTSAREVADRVLEALAARRPEAPDSSDVRRSSV